MRSGDTKQNQFRIFKTALRDTETGTGPEYELESRLCNYGEAMQSRTDVPAGIGLMQRLTSDVVLVQGAEAIIREGSYLDRRCIIKERVSKSYRLEQLDRKINKQRFLQEVRCIFKCLSLGIRVPSIYFLESHDSYRIYFEYIEGNTLKDKLLHPTEEVDHRLGLLSTSLGEILARMHNGDIFHGDLTSKLIF